MIAKAENMASSLFNGTQVNNCDEVYASYNWINASKLSTMFVDELGSLKMVTWVGKWVEFYSVQCVAYGQCGAYGYCNSTMGKISSVRAFLDTSPGRQRSGTCMRDASDGCIKKHEELSMCGNGEGFVKVVNAKIPDTSKACVWMGVSVHECKDECLRKCSCLAGLHQICTSIDTLTPNQSIIDGNVLVSCGGTFALGFFRPGNSSRTYVGIWYNKISEQTFIWVANRDRPINGTFGVLSLNRDGNLVIYDNIRNFTVWHTNVSAVAYSAQLLDSGNLVLCQGDGGSGGIVWQSFDHPTNTLLPHMKLGWDRRMGLERFLTSWKSTDDPSTGEYSLRLELNEWPQLILFKGASSPVWRLPTRLKRTRSAKAEDTAGSKFNVTLVNNLDEVYTSYTPINASNLSAMFVDELGTLKMETWVGKWVKFYAVLGDQCVAYGRCGAYGYCDPNNGQDFECTCLPGYEPRSTEEWNLRDASGGCIKKREELSMCGNGEGFVNVANAKIPDTSKAHVWMSLSMHECKDECLRNCSCLAYTSAARSKGDLHHLHKFFIFFIMLCSGYMAPEYAIDGLFSTKSDIFSFGVIVLEIMSGKRNRKFHHADHDLNLLGHAWKLWIDGKAFELIVPMMEGSFSMSKLLRCIQIGLLCVQKRPEDRPTISSVVLMLVSDIVALPQPKQPGFYIERSSEETHECSQAQISPSINEVTMSHLEAR
ncbi:hypothetical protein RHSIM_Rhsim11G0081400 [Rhododendron simsii]|uniref:Receptor-like serine/threonine-protein kinase n=1 Tax=Rhododendron simsii TaxID=118357 RepID=A0A834GA88_RHOSS|nr:hypothetical protein RHSIM_Rhsim11G0081400 [Rhododendron simsii]